MTLRTSLTAGTAVAAALVLGLAAPAQASTTVVVYESTAASQGWATGDMRGSGAVDWTPDGLVLSTPLSADKAQFGTALSGPLSSLTALSYGTTVLAPGSIPEQRAALNLVIDFNGAATGGFATLVYEPVYNGMSFDAVRGGDAVWWSTRAMPGVPNAFTSYVSLADIVAANPDAVMQGLLVNQGSGNPGLESLVESIRVDGTTYLFAEGAPPLTSKADCKDGGWQASTAPAFRNQGDCVSFFSR